MTVSLIDSLLLGAGHSLVRPVVIIDTKAAINSICYRVRTGHPGRLEQAIQPRHLGLVPLLPSRHLPEEVDKHLAARGARRASTRVPWAASGMSGRAPISA
jgi:hypothetical protein